MKIPSYRFLLPTFAGLLFSTSAHAGIAGINSAPSHASIIFDDTHSTGGGTGTLHTPGPVSSWTGSPYGTPLYTDGATGDTGQGGLGASFTASSYALHIPSAAVSHIVGNTGYAALDLQATVEIQVDASGFLSSALYPTLFIDGTVQTGGYAYLAGSITYNRLALGQVDILSYNYQTTTVGAFSVAIPGVATYGAPIALPSNDKLTLVANFHLQADPASIHVSTVPEPATGMLALLSLPLLLQRRRR